MERMWEHLGTGEEREAACGNLLEFVWNLSEFVGICWNLLEFVGILALSGRRELRNSCWATVSWLRMRNQTQGKFWDGKIPSPASKNDPQTLG